MSYGVYADRARRIFKYGEVRGDGKYGAILKCTRKWVVKLFEDEARRNEVLNERCAGGVCVFRHDPININLA